MTLLKCRERTHDLSHVAIMGILNITPDSFSDGGDFLSVDKALVRAREMADEGADIIDVGGESTRPDAATVSVQEELDRVIPVIGKIASGIDVTLSIDTSKPEVMRAAVDAGAGFINDVNALRAEGSLYAARDAGVPVCLMHMQGEPRTMQQDPHYRDVVADIREFLQQRLDAATAAGIDKSQLIVDPGFGFGKTFMHNATLLRKLSEFQSLEVPLLVGLSRKSMIGTALDLPVDRRLHASVALALMAAQNGARIIRVHDVAPSKQAIRMWEAVYQDRDGA